MFLFTAIAFSFPSSSSSSKYEDQSHDSRFLLSQHSCSSCFKCRGADRCFLELVEEVAREGAENLHKNIKPNVPFEVPRSAGKMEVAELFVRFIQTPIPNFSGNMLYIEFCPLSISKIFKPESVRWSLPKWTQDNV